MRSSRLRSLLSITAVIVVIVVVFGVVSALREPINSSAGTKAPPLTGEDLGGRSRDLADLRERIVLVNFWASWCAPCKEETAVLVAAQQRHAEDDLAVLGVNSQDRLRYARRAAQAWGADAYPSIHDEDGSIAVEWGVVGLPETFVIGRDGVILARHKGPATQQWLDDTVAPLVGKTSTP